MTTKFNNLTGLAVKFEYSVISLVWFFPVSYLAVLLGHLLLIEQGASQPRLHLFALIVSSVFLLSLWLIDQILTKTTTDSVRAKVKLFAVVLIGGLRGIEIYYLGIWLGLDSGVSLGYRIWNSTLTSVVWLGLLSYVVNNQRGFQTRYRKLISQSLLNKSSGISEAELDLQLAQIEQSLKAIKFDDVHPNQLAIAAQDVKAKIDELIRPLSKRLWLDSISDYPRIKFPNVLMEAIRELKVPVLPIAIFYLATSIVNLTSVISLAEATSRSLVNLAVALVIYYGLSRVRFHQPAFDFGFGLLKLALFAVVPSLISELLHAIVLFDNPSPIMIAALLPLPVLMIAFAIIRIVNADRNYLVNSLNNELTAPYSGFQKSQVASYLHNSLQSELLAMANQLERAATAADPEHAQAILEQLGALINRSVSEDFRNLYASPEKRLDQVIANWQGILDIKIIDSELIFALPNKAVIAIQLIEELASNTIKHSNETNLEISCEILGDKLRLLTTTAVSSASKSKAGLGTTLMQTYLSSSPVAPNRVQFEI